MITSQPECCCNTQQSEEKLHQQLDEILSDYSGRSGVLISVLQIVQNLFGYLPEYALKKISIALNKPYSEVAGVVSFYSFFSTVPRGKHLIRVCLGTACYVRGGKHVLDALKTRLNIDVGQTTEDRMFSLEVARCFGACGLAPTMSIDDEVFKRVRPVKINEIINKYYEKDSSQEKGAV